MTEMKCECGWTGTIKETVHRVDSGDWGFCDQHECPDCLTVLVNNLDND